MLNETVIKGIRKEEGTIRKEKIYEDHNVLSTMREKNIVKLTRVRV